MTYSFTDLLAAAAPLPIEYCGQFLAGAAQALALIGDGDAPALLDRIQRSYLARVMLETPGLDGDCFGDSEAPRTDIAGAGQAAT
jgi:HEAT repeat protein